MKQFMVIMLALMVSPSMVWAYGKKDSHHDHAADAAHKAVSEAHAEAKSHAHDHAHSLKEMSQALGLSEEQSQAVSKLMETYESVKSADFKKALSQVLTDEQMDLYHQMHGMKDKAMGMMKGEASKSTEAMDKAAKKMNDSAAEATGALKGAMDAHDHKHEHKGSH